jgi:anti-sigma regulatory factor (Ser/Thr protein kinase)
MCSAPGGEASTAQRCFAHQALIYGSDQEFLDVALPFVEEGIAAGEPTLVAVQRRNVEKLGEALGGDPGATLLSVEQWYETSARTRDKFGRWASENVAGGRARLIGEPPWAIGNDAQVRDWARHESVTNIAFDGLPVTFICPYDARELPPEIIEHAQGTHPEIVHRSGTIPSGSYEDPRDFCRRLDSAVHAPSGAAVAELVFDLGDLQMLRQAVESAAVGAGLSAMRVGEIVLAVNEIATNAVIHGSPPATLRVWKEPGEIVFEVADDGEGIKDVLAGQLRPPSQRIGGRGLWLTRMLSDVVEIRNGHGCTVSVHASAPTLNLGRRR